MLKTMNNLAALYSKQGKYDLALPLYEKALEGRRRILGEDHPSTLNSRYWLGVCLVNLKLFPRGESALLAAYEGCLRVFGETHPGTTASIKQLINLYEGWNKPEEAAKWKAKLPKKEQKTPEKKK